MKSSEKTRLGSILLAVNEFFKFFVRCPNYSSLWSVIELASATLKGMAKTILKGISGGLRS